MAGASRSRLLSRAVGAAARRIGRPEIYSAFYPAARRGELDAVAMRAILAASLAEDSFYVDVGANRGQVLADALRVAPRGRHVAFEPIPELARSLAEHYPGLDVRALALSAQPGRASFTHYTRLDGWSGLLANPEISEQRGAPVTIDVEVSTLDLQLPDGMPALVKIDVEGNELAVLEGASALLERARPLLLVEHAPDAARLYGGDSLALSGLLHAAGYRVFAVTGEGPFGAAELQRGDFVNWLARPRA